MNNVSQEEIKEPSELYNVTILVLWNKICENMKKIKKIEDARKKKVADEDKKQEEKDNKKENTLTSSALINQIKNSVNEAKNATGEQKELYDTLEKFYTENKKIKNEINEEIVELKKDYAVLYSMPFLSNCFFVIPIEATSGLE